MPDAQASHQEALIGHGFGSHDATSDMSHVIAFMIHCRAVQNE